MHSLHTVFSELTLRVFWASFCLIPHWICMLQRIMYSLTRVQRCITLEYASFQMNSLLFYRVVPCCSFLAGANRILQKD